MQAENAQEWTMREKLSSEKLVLERENKRMKNEITRLEDELRERSRLPAAAAVDVDVKILQDELASKTKVFCCICITVLKIYAFRIYWSAVFVDQLSILSACNRFEARDKNRDGNNSKWSK